MDKRAERLLRKESAEAETETVRKLKICCRAGIQKLELQIPETVKNCTLIDFKTIYCQFH